MFSSLTSGGRTPRNLATSFSASFLRQVLLRHHFANADIERLQLEQDEKALEDRDVELLLAHEFPEIAPLVLPRRGTAVIDQAFVEGAEVDAEIESVVRFLGQDHFDVGGIDTDVIGMLEDDLDLLEQPLLHVPALGHRVLARHQQIAVGAECFVGSQNLLQIGVVLLAAPMFEVMEKAPRRRGLSRRPGVRVGQPVNERGDGDGDEALAAANILGLDLVKPCHDDRIAIGRDWRG